MSLLPDQPSGVTVTSKTVTTIVGLIAIIASLFTVIDRVNKYEHRLDIVERSDAQTSHQMNSLAIELRTLNNKLTELTIEIREMKAVNAIRTP